MYHVARGLLLQTGIKQKIKLDYQVLKSSKSCVVNYIIKIFVIYSRFSVCSGSSLRLGPQMNRLETSDDSCVDLFEMLRVLVYNTAGYSAFKDVI